MVLEVKRKEEEYQDEQIDYYNREDSNDDYPYTLKDKIRDELKKDED